MKKLENLYAVILAGGLGTRFWPLSRQDQPKQFLKIVHEHSLFQMTLMRLAPRVRPENVVVVTNKKYGRVVKAQARDVGLKLQHVLLETSGKNTAPAICWAASMIHQLNAQAIMAVFPADHLILHEKKFIQVLDRAVALAKHQHLVTVGLRPTRPETGYGYLKTVQRKDGRGQTLFVDQFTEKPALVKAKRFIKNKAYLWNSGMFVWQTDAILKSFSTHLPFMLKLFNKYPGKPLVTHDWNRLKGISIDYGILEKSDHVVAVLAEDIGWSDLGSWESLYDALEKNAQANVIRGEVAATDTTQSLIYGGQRLIGVIGLKDVVVVDTPDALLVCRKQDSQGIKNLVEYLVATKRKEI